MTSEMVCIRLLSNAPRKYYRWHEDGLVEVFSMIVCSGLNVKIYLFANSHVQKANSKLYVQLDTSSTTVRMQLGKSQPVFAFDKVAMLCVRCVSDFCCA